MSASSSEVSMDRRVALLATLPSFETLDPAILKQIAAAMAVESHTAGQKVVCESQMGDRMYLIENGRVEISAKGAMGKVPLGDMGVGEIFGEIALLSETKRRRATVEALTDVVLLTLGVEDFEKIANEFPEVRDDLATAADALMAARLEALMEANRRKKELLGE